MTRRPGDHPGGEADQLSSGRAHTKIVSINWAIKEWKMLLLRHNGWQHCGPGDPCLVTTCAAAGAEGLITDTQLFRSDQGRASGVTTPGLWLVAGRQAGLWLALIMLLLFWSDITRVSRTRPRQDTESSPPQVPLVSLILDTTIC